MEGEVVGGKTFKGEENVGSRPKGCYLEHYSGGKPYRILWNNHLSGSPNKWARQICISGKKGRIVNVQILGQN